MNKVLLSVSVLALLGGAPHAVACTCAPPPPVKQALLDAEAVFAGKVVEIKRQNPSDNPFGSLEVTFQVLESWKGKRTKKLKVFTSRSSASCGYPFFKNEDYLIYAHPFQNQQLTTNICTRTKSLDQAYDDLEILGPGQG